MEFRIKKFILKDFILKIKKDKKYHEQSLAWILSNEKNNVEWLAKITKLFGAQFRRKAFLHHYVR
jgi:hypothetical protein